MREDRLAIPAGFVRDLIPREVALHGLMLLVVEHERDFMDARVVRLRRRVFPGLLLHLSCLFSFERVKVHIFNEE